MNYIVLVFSVMLNTIGMVLFKHCMKRLNQIDTISVVSDIIINPLLLVAIIAMLGGLILLGNVLLTMNLSVAFPISAALGYIFVACASWQFFEERIAPIQVAGFLFLVIGSVLVAQQ